MITDRILYLLEKYNAGSLSQTDREELDAWYNREQETNLPLYDEMHHFQQKDELYQQLMEALDKRSEKRYSKRKVLQRWTVAASFLLIAVVLYKFYPDENKTMEVAETTVMKTSTIASVKNETKKKQTIFLKDSSKMILWPGASITYDSSFQQNRRAVQLQGEAYFNVRKDPQMPFSVSANGIIVTALGTSFTISSHKADSNMDVLLHDGRVSVQADGTASVKMQTVYLLPGEKLTIHPVSLARSIQKAPAAINKKPEQPVARKVVPAVLHFDQEALSKVLDKLATHYNILITYDLPHIKDLDFSGSLQLRENAADVLQRISVVNGLTVTPVVGGYRLVKN